MEMLYICVQMIACVGLVCGVLMFWTVKKPHAEKKDRPLPTLSIIIPARNEALRLPPLLKSLQAQSVKHVEILVVDDDSADNTAEVAASYGAKVLTSEQIGQMSPGKSNACAYGAKFATGECYLFLDADVQLASDDSLAQMLQSFQQQRRGILSIQPYHRIVETYENLSVIFNVIMITGMNVFSIWQNKFQTAGSFGPCILCDKESYLATGGHEAAEESIMDDFALSDVFLAQNLPVTNYLGKDLIHMRMYEEGPKQLIEGWTKNLATASQSTNRFIMLLVQLWIFGVIMSVVAVTTALFTGLAMEIICSITLYMVYGAHTYLLARRVGSFSIGVIFFYPLFVLFFIAIFVYSLYRTHVLHSVMWRGRKIKV